MENEELNFFKQCIYWIVSTFAFLLFSAMTFVMITLYILSCIIYSKNIYIILTAILYILMLYLSKYFINKVKRDYPDEKILYINKFNDFDIFMIINFIALSGVLILLPTANKFLDTIAIIFLITTLFSSIDAMFPEILTNKRYIRYLYFFNKKKYITLLKDFKDIRETFNGIDYLSKDGKRECIDIKGFMSYEIIDYIVKRYSSAEMIDIFINKLKEAIENSDKENGEI